MAETLFTKIIARQIPAKIAYEDERYIVIHDINPQAPVHLLVITKKEIPTLNDLSAADAELVGGMFLVAAKVMKEAGHTDYRTVFNCGPGRSSRCFTFICMCWRVGPLVGRRDKGKTGGKKKTPPFWGRCLPEGRKCAEARAIPSCPSCLIVSISTVLSSSIFLPVRTVLFLFLLKKIGLTLP